MVSGSHFHRVGLRDVLGSRAFYILRRGHIIGRYYLGLTYDPDYAYVRKLKPNCTILDVGANGGQSALEFGRLRPDANIISFEANLDNLADLRIARWVLGDKYQYHHVALSDRTENARLYVPVVGNTPLPGEASLELELLDEVQDRIGKITKIIEHPVALRTLDSFGLVPDFVKIDVQGHEPAVLRGMSQLIQDHRPVIMLEMCAGFEEVKDFLHKAGYSLFIYDPNRDELSPSDTPTTVNFFALPDERAG